MHPPPHQGASSVLVVDDDVDLRMTLTAILEEAGYPVRAAANGREALDVLRGSSSRWIVLLDLSMPVMDGFAVLDELGRDRSLPAAHVIVMTGGTTRSGRLGHVELLEKPLDPAGLLERLAGLQSRA